MRKLRMMLALTLALLMTVACAEGTLSARLNGQKLTVQWDGCGAGEGVLTLYQNSWPIQVCNVRLSEGGASFSLGSVEGRYSVRLKTDAGCVTADVVRDEREDIHPTQKPTEVENNKPEQTVKPTEVANIGTAIPTPAPTETPTPAPTATSTPVPTRAPASTNVASGTARDDLAAQVVAQTNEERAARGLSALRVDEALNRAAAVRAAEIVRSFSHTRPDGSSWSTVSSRAYGENIAKGQRTADRVMAAWMSSEGHRANILRESYGSIGVCAFVSDGVTYWVQLFGK